MHSKGILALSLLLFTTPLAAQGWSNLGGNAARNGLVDTVGPTAPDVAWGNTDDFSIIAWAPFVDAGRVFTVREAAFPQDGGAANDALVAYDLEDGDELWRTTLPFAGDTSVQWIAWIAGARDGRVYASRASNSTPQPIRAYDAATGAFLWESEAIVSTFAYDGVVFSDDGDLVVGDFGAITRIDGATGATEWGAAYSCSVSGSCGVALSDDGVFVDEVVPGGHVLLKFDLASGARLYDSDVMPGFTSQNPPFVSPDGGAVYFARSQNNATTDFLYSWEDTGSDLLAKWDVPVRWTTSHEHGIGPDGTVYTLTRDNELVGLDPDTGAERFNAGVLTPPDTSGNFSPRTAVDARGTVYLSNGWASSPATEGRLWAYTADLSTQLFELTLDRQNQGGPALAPDGTLVVCDRQGVYAWRCRTLAEASSRNSGGNPASYTSGLPVLGMDFTAAVDLGGTTGHPLAGLVGFATPLDLTLPGGQVLLVNALDPQGELLARGVQGGPVAGFSAPVPNDPALCGFGLATQALHFGGGLPFALSNAVDLVLGR